MFILLKIYLLWKIWPIPVKAVETGVDPRLVIQELHYLSTVLFWKNKKQLPEENNWTWVKRPVLISLAEDKIAPIWSTTQACFFFTSSLQFSSEAMKWYQAILDLFQLHDYSVFTFLRENHSFMVSTNFLFE